MTYNKEFLIKELCRFHSENSRAPKQLDMQPKFGYPSFANYRYHFGSYNNALKIARLQLNRRTLDETETCSYCGKRADEIPNFKTWLYHNNVRYCRKHGQNGIPDYVTGNLDINTSNGLGRAGEILVVKTLEIGNEHDCNRISCGYSFDMYHEEYGRIDVKTSLLSDISNRWSFKFLDKLEIKTFICVGLSSDRSIVKHVWLIPNEGKIRNLTGLGIYNNKRSLFNRKHWEVDAKLYNDVWQEMLMNYRDGACKIFK